MLKVIFKSFFLFIVIAGCIGYALIGLLLIAVKILAGITAR